MDNVINKERSEWIRPWMKASFDDLYDHDDRFFSIVVKGALAWLSKNIVLYNKGIQHFIFNTGSSYMYIESDGYSFSWNETTGEDQMYMKMPRCIVTLSNISIPSEELSNKFAHGIYERLNGTTIQGYNAEIQRMPIEISLSLKYVLSNFNEELILIEELMNKVIYQRYFQIVYLGQTIECSLEFPSDFSVNINPIDMTSADVNQKVIEVELKLCSNYPRINERTEVQINNIIRSFGNNSRENVKPDGSGGYYGPGQYEGGKWKPLDPWNWYQDEDGNWHRKPKDNDGYSDGSIDENGDYHEGDNTDPDPNYKENGEWEEDSNKNWHHIPPTDGYYDKDGNWKPYNFNIYPRYNQIILNTTNSDEKNISDTKQYIIH